MLGTFSSFVIILFSFLFLIAACKKEAPHKKSMLIEEKNGLIFLQGSNTPFTGTVHDTVNKKVVSYEVVEGIKNGEFKISSLNGKIEMSGKMVNGKNEGKWQYFYPGGELESEGYFMNDSANGKWTWFYEDSVKKEEGFLINGKKDGRWVQYDEKGNIVLETFFKDDQEIDNKINK